MSYQNINFTISWQSSEDTELFEILTSPPKTSSFNNLDGFGAQLAVIEKEVTFQKVLEQLILSSEITKNLKELFQIEVFSGFFIMLVLYIISPITVTKVPSELEIFFNIFEQEKFTYKIVKEQLYQLMEDNDVSRQQIDYGISFLIEKNLVKEYENGDLIITRKLLKKIEINFI
ncbi:hypothetical protein [Alysiella filiformis]|uniref:Uncharacterized protein n=1 Tax=Alysiella filiformis DSM 16848 TaxID=1120981 RepID=A0A286EH92_9NEIS|nr:hypothetical protein [Alysiella filiformis]QMT32325.1 hypothetical protein H3L97_05720 [Alysiella filiformis]UBQ56755.1 hypothetical protein JF568_02970 [Alysiella filiformis DSM 16848]SOD70268.1 hypothetical protein SAMN02746062_02050 [Alysiella filiformis DSM 16848]